MRAHKLKIWTEQFQAIKNGLMTAQIRRHDRHFMPHDFILFTEFDAGQDQNTGKYIGAEILSVTLSDAPPHALMDGYCLLSVVLCTHLEMQALLGQSEMFSPEWIKST